MSAATPKLEVVNATKRFGSLVAVSGVSMTVDSRARTHHTPPW